MFPDCFTFFGTVSVAVVVLVSDWPMMAYQYRRPGSYRMQKLLRLDSTCLQK